MLVEECGVQFTTRHLSKALRSKNPELIDFVLSLPLDSIQPKKIYEWEYAMDDPLWVVVRAGNRKAVKTLLEAGYQVDDRGALLQAYAQKNRSMPSGQTDRKILKWLLRYHEDQLGGPETHLVPFCTPVLDGDLELLKFLIKIGAAKVDEVDPDSGETLLLFAVKKGLTQLVENLLRCGADPVAKGRLSLSPLAIARQMGFSEIAALLQPNSAAAKRSQKRKREEPNKEGDQKKETQTGEKEEEQKKPAETTEKQAKKPRKRAPLSDEEQAHGLRIIELVERLDELSPPHHNRISRVRGWKEMSVFALKNLSRALDMKPIPAKKLDIMKALVAFLEQEEAVVQSEV